MQGEINRATGEAALEFVANFMFTAGPIYKVCCVRMLPVSFSFVPESKCAVYIRAAPLHMQAPPLYVVTHLTTEEVQGTRRHGNGSRLDANGFSRCVRPVTTAYQDACCNLFNWHVFVQAGGMCYSSKNRFLAN